MMYIAEYLNFIMIHKRIFLLSIFLLPLIGCVQRNILRTFDDIESFILDRPDSALYILDTMDRSHLRTDQTRARHALLHAMALDKNFIDVSEDSIAQVAVDYYSKHGPQKYYARSLYYLGLAYYYQDEYSRAIVEFTKAEEVAGTSDSLYLGMTKVAQADSYAKTYNYIEEYQCLEDAERIFSRLSNEYFFDVVRLNKIHSLYNQQKDNEAESLLIELLNDETLDSDLRHLVNITYAFVLFRREAFDKVLSIYENVLKNGYEEFFTLRDYWVWAYSLNALGKTEEATDIINQLCGNDSGTSSFWKYKISKYNGDVVKSLEYLEEYVDYNDMEVSTALKQSLALSQRNYYESQAEVSAYKVHNTRLTMLIITLVSLFTFLLIFIFLKMYMRRQKEIRERYLLSISEISRQLEEAKREDYPSLKKKYISLYKSKFETIGALYEQFVHSKDLVNAEKSVYNKVAALVDDFTEDYTDSKKFETMLNEDMDNIMFNLHVEMPQLKKKDFVIFSLFVIGFDATTISHLLNTTMNTIYIRKSRIRHQIEESTAQHKEQFLDVLGQI